MASALPRRHLLAALLSLLLAGFAVTGSAGSAHAADGYRYWNYFHVKNGALVFATTGAASFVPQDGGIEAYRFGTSTPQQGLEPRVDLTKVTFGSVCSTTKPQAGEKRVAVLLDFGTKADSGGAQVPHPRAACAQVPTKDNGMQVLGSVAKVRTQKGMICGLDGYPASGCGEAVPNATVPTQEPKVDFTVATPASTTSAPVKNASSGTGGNTPLLVGGVVVVVLLVAGGVALGRRNRQA
jgi:hypothetical protein